MFNRESLLAECESLSGLKTLDQFYQQLLGFTDRAGLAQTLYTVIPTFADHGADSSPYAFVSSYDADWMDYYVDKRYDLNDRALVHCLSGSDQPYIHSANTSLVGFSQKEKIVSSDARQAGVKSLISIPMRNAFGALGIMSFNHDGSGSEFDRFYSERKDLLLLYALTLNEFVHKNAMAEISESFGKTLAPNITPREKEVLRYLAEGLTYDQIADRLTVGVSTIRKHVQALIVKLKARNATHACALALRWGLVW